MVMNACVLKQSFDRFLFFGLQFYMLYIYAICFIDGSNIGYFGSIFYMFSMNDLSNQRVFSSKDPKAGQEWRGRSPGSMPLIILRLQDKIVKDGKRKVEVWM